MCNLEHDEFNSGFQILRTGPSSTDAHAPRRTRRRRSTKARRSEGSSSIKEITTASLLRGFAALKTLASWLPAPRRLPAAHHEKHADDDPRRPEDPKGLLQSKKSQQLRYSVASRLLKTLASWLPGSATAPRRAPRRTRRRRSTKARRSEGSSSINEITTASLLRGFAAFQNS